MTESDEFAMAHAGAEMLAEDIAALVADIGPDLDAIGTIQERVRLWYDLDKALSELKELVDSLSENCGQVIQGNAIQVSGIGILRGIRSFTEKYDEEVANEVARLISREVALNHGGELLAQQAAAEAVQRLYDVSRQSWRKGDLTKQTPGLKSLGINPDDCMSRTPGRWRLDITGK